MFGVFTFGSPYFSDAISVTHGAAEPHVIDAFAQYSPFTDSFASYLDRVDAFGMYDEATDSLASEGEE